MCVGLMAGRVLAEQCGGCPVQEVVGMAGVGVAWLCLLCSGCV